MKVELDLSKHATKADLKNATGVDTSKFAKKVDLKSNVDKLDVDKLQNKPSNLGCLKSKVDKLDTRKLETTQIDLSKLSNVVKNNILKITENNAKIKNIEDKTPDITNLITILTNLLLTTLNAKINAVKGEIPGISNLAKIAALTAVENKIPNVSSLV